MTTGDRPGPDAAAVALDGSWEREGRNPAGAALFGLFGIGAVYFYGQTILLFLCAGIASVTGPAPRVGGEPFPFRPDFFVHYIGSIRLALFLSQYFCMLLPALWLVKRWHTRERRNYLRYTRTTLPALACAVIGTVALFPISNEIGSFFQRLFPLPRVFEEMTEGVFRAREPVEFLWLVLLVAVTPAICEETLFRGYAQRTLERTIGWKSVLVVGIIFGLFHMSPLGLVSLSLVGLFLGYLFYRSGSIYPSMAAHFTNNFLAILIISVRPRIGGIDLATATGLPAGWLLMSGAIFLLSVYVLRAMTHPEGSDREQFTEPGDIPSGRGPALPAEEAPPQSPVAEG